MIATGSPLHGAASRQLRWKSRNPREHEEASPAITAMIAPLCTSSYTLKAMQSHSRRVPNERTLQYMYCASIR
jgi:hypothetical protein